MLENITVHSGNTKVGTLSGYNRTYSFNGAFKKEEGNDIQTLLVDNMAIKLIGKVSQPFAGLPSPIVSKGLSAAWNATKDPTRDIFYMGSETPVENIPQHGVVTYQGNASRYDNVKNQVKNIGDAKLVANFDDKTIYGELDMKYPRRNIALHKASIVGNSFQGKAVAEGNFPFFIDRDGQYEGKFFGPHAEEVAGKATFSGETLIGQVESLNTSFSAEQTK
jgi:Transferrin binding protein-like solute binding protein.